MSLFETALVITSTGLAIIILISALFNFHSLMKFNIPKESEISALKRVFIIRNLFSVIIAFIFLQIMYLHATSDNLIFNHWYMVFHYFIFLILYIDTCAIRVYVNLENRRMTKVRREDMDFSHLSERRVI